MRTSAEKQRTSEGAKKSFNVVVDLKVYEKLQVLIQNSNPGISQRKAGGTAIEYFVSRVDDDYFNVNAERTKRRGAK